MTREIRLLTMANTEMTRYATLALYDHSGKAPADDRTAVQEVIPDVRDGLTRTERLILHVLHQTQHELGGRNVPTVMLYGRVLEYVNISEAELHVYLDRLGVRGN